MLRLLSSTALYVQGDLIHLNYGSLKSEKVMQELKVQPCKPSHRRPEFLEVLRALQAREAHRGSQNQGSCFCGAGPYNRDGKAMGASIMQQHLHHPSWPCLVFRQW